MRACSIVLFTYITCNTFAFAQLTDAVTPWLKQPVLTQGVAAGEWASFLSARVPGLELPETAEQWDRQSARLRRRSLNGLVFRGVPDAWRRGPVQVVWTETIETGKGYVLRKLRYEAAPGLWIPALLYEPIGVTERVPAVLNVNGHVGPPGKAIEYEQVRCINLAKRGLYALHPEWLSFGELGHEDYRHDKLVYLDVCGVSGLSIFYLAMQRGLDVLATHKNVDADRIAMTGLSGGGWQTIVLSALDTRVAVSVPNAGYSSLLTRVEHPSDIGDIEQVPMDMLTIADYRHYTAMLAPRPALLIYNAKDECCFRSDHMPPSVYDPVVPFYELYGMAHVFEFYENTDPGTHNYERDNREQFYRFINHHFGLDPNNEDLPCEGELKSPAELTVGIPEDNATFVTLASSFASGLPLRAAPQDDPIELERWQQDAKERLRRVLRIPESVAAAAVQLDQGEAEGVRATRFALVAGAWTVPAVVIEPAAGRPDITMVLFADNGKESLAREVAAHLESGARVIAVDLLLTGECRIHPDHSWQHGMMIDATGERVLGQQVAQVGSVIDWARQEFAGTLIGIHSKGWNTGVVALAYGGLNRQGLVRLITDEAPATLKDLIEQRMEYRKLQPLFCFGLLREFDIPDLAAMCVETDARVRRKERDS